MLDIPLLMLPYSLSTLVYLAVFLDRVTVWAASAGLPSHPGSDLIRTVGPQETDWFIEEVDGGRLFH